MLNILTLLPYQRDQTAATGNMKKTKKIKINSTKVLVGMGIQPLAHSDAKLLFSEFQVHVTSAACTFPQMFMFIRYRVYV